MHSRPAAAIAPMPAARLRRLLQAMRQARVVVVGDVMLDQFVWGRVTRISPEAPVPVVDFERESFMPGGAANVARNLTSLGASPRLAGVVGDDSHGRILARLLEADGVPSRGLVRTPDRPTSVKTRIVAGQQQIARLDREVRGPLPTAAAKKLLRLVAEKTRDADAIIVADYAKGVVSQPLLDALRTQCKARGQWLSMDPKPGHALDIRGVSLLTPNRKETFELAGIADATRHPNPHEDPALLQAAASIQERFRPALLLVTLGELGVLLCTASAPPLHIPAVNHAIFDVSGAGDTVIATFTLAIAAGASPPEAALLANHAAGVVVGKVGTATASPSEITESILRHQP
ncbi:MAG: bifunctional heptose 7-phosphate kinase/heptose 1-phosphate adenyltransferase [Verrucomicrobiota bacterium]